MDGPRINERVAFVSLVKSRHSNFKLFRKLVANIPVSKLRSILNIKYGNSTFYEMATFSGEKTQIWNVKVSPTVHHSAL